MRIEKSKIIMERDIEIEQYLRYLGLSWITIAELMSDDNYDKTIRLITINPKITKDELLKIMEITEVEY